MYCEPNETIARVKSSPVGTQIVYHEGFLVSDRGSSRPDRKSDLEKEITFIADEVYAAYLDGFCALVQKRIKLRVYQYIAIVLSTDNRIERSLRNRQLYNSIRIEKLYEKDLIGRREYVKNKVA